MSGVKVGDVVEVKSLDGMRKCGIVEQIIGGNFRIRLSGQYGYGDWFSGGEIVSHAKLGKK